MKNWISRWFGKGEAAAPVAAVSSHPSPPAPPFPKVRPPEGEPKPVPSAEVMRTLRLHHASDVNALFYRWLIGQHQKTPLPSSEFEKKILTALETLAKSESGGASLVPRVPAVIPQLLKSLRDENSSALDLARQISHDIVLVAEVIHEANSPFYHPAKPIHNIENAVMLLGQNGLRLVIARVAFRPVINMQAGHFAQLVAPKIWAQSEKCADACKILSGPMKADPFIAYLAGLIQNVGMIVAFRMIDHGYRGKVLPDSDHFCYSFFRLTRLLSASIAQAWDFPQQVIQGLEKLALGEWTACAMEEALFMSDQMGKLRILVDQQVLQEEEHFTINGLSPEAEAYFHQMRFLTAA